MAYEFLPNAYWPNIYWPEKYWPIAETLDILPAFIAQILSNAQFACSFFSNSLSMSDIKCNVIIKEEDAAIPLAVFKSQVISAALYSGNIDENSNAFFGSTMLAASVFKSVFVSNTIFEGEIIAKSSIKSTWDSNTLFSASRVASSNLTYDFDT